MTRMRKLYGIVVLSCSLLTLPHAAHAWGGKGGRGEGFMKAVQQLDLSADQKKKLKEMHEANKGSLAPKREAMKSAHDDFSKAMQGTASDDEVRKKFDAFKAARDEFMKARFEKVLAVRAILTPEQRAKFQGLRGNGKFDHDDED